MLVYENVLSLQLIDAVKRWVDGGEIPLSRTNLDSWNANVVKFSGAILIRDIVGERKEMILASVAKSVPLPTNDWDRCIVMHHRVSRFGYIPWHDDGDYAESLTVYLNERWEPDWAGYLVVEHENGQMEALLPKFNTGVLLQPPVRHAMTMPSIEAPLRDSLQIFVRKRAT